MPQLSTPKAPKESEVTNLAEIARERAKEKDTWVFRLKRKKYNGKFPFSENIPSICEIFDPIKGHNRTIVYKAGSHTVFLDEMSDDDKDRALKRPTSILIQNGALSVSNRETNLLTFLLLSGNVAGGVNDDHRIPGRSIIAEVFDSESNALKRNHTRERRIKVEQTILDMDPHGIKALGMVTIDNHGSLSAIERYSTSEIRDILLNIAFKNPDKIFEKLNDPKSKNQYIISKAISRGLLQFDERANTILNQDGESILTAHGRNAVLHMSDLATKDQEWMNYVDELRDLIEPKKKEDEAHDNSSEPSGKIDWVDALITELKEAGVVRLKSMNFYFKGEKGDEEKLTPTQLKDRMKKDGKFLEFLASQLK